MKTKRPKIAELREYIYYDPETGEMVWIKDKGRARVGDTVGTERPDGYFEFKFNGVHLRVHVVAWALRAGRWPSGPVDHRNNKRDDHRWSNLRQTTTAKNNMNRRIHSHNTSGYKGVSWSKSDSRWRASIYAGSKKIHIGNFKDPIDAAIAYDKKARELHGAYASLNFPRGSIRRNERGT